MKLSFFLLLSFYLVSCGGNGKKLNEIDSDLNVVDLEKENKEKYSPKIASDGNLINGVGPGLGGTSLNSIGKGKRKVWGLVLGPGLNRVICHAVAVRALKEKGVTFNVITGSGMSAIVAAFLAKGTTPEIIEWRFHKFFQNSKDLKPFSSEWLNQVKKDLLFDFKGQKIQSLKYTLVLPVLNKVERKIEFVRRGDLHGKLLENISLSSGTSGYSSPLLKSDFKDYEIRKFGVQKVVKLNVLASKVNFEKNEDYLFGIYSRLSKKPAEGSQKSDYLMTLPIDGFSLDSIRNLPEFLRVSYLFSRDGSQEIVSDFLNESKN